MRPTVTNKEHPEITIYHYFQSVHNLRISYVNAYVTVLAWHPTKYYYYHESKVCLCVYCDPLDADAIRVM